MLLRTRLALFVSLAFLVLVGGLVFTAAERERLLEQSFATVAISGQQALWGHIIADEAHRLGSFMDQVTGNAALKLALQEKQRDRIVEIARGLADALTSTGGVDELELTTVDGTRIFSSASRIDTGSVLDVGSLHRITMLRNTVAGLVQDGPTRYVVAMGAPLIANGDIVGVATLVVNARRALTRFARSMTASAFLVSLRGRVVQGTDTGLRTRIPADIPIREGSFSVLAAEGQVLSLTSAPIRDVDEQITGALVTLKDATEALSKARRLGSIAIGGGVLFVGLVILGLYIYLRHAFRPLEGAINVLRALSEGDTSVTLEAEGAGEIGRIAQAVSVFRSNAITLSDQRRQVDRQRRRQERLIRRQMEQLASTLETEARHMVIEDLRSAVAEPSGTPGSAEDDQLRLLAAVLHRMAARIAAQHARLTELIEELKEAVVTRAKLAGLQQELEIARQVQTAILPQAPPRLAELDIDGQMVPAKEVGGDFYDYFSIDADRVGIVVADVSGKGVPAALFMAITRTLLKATALFIPSPAACVERLNDLLAAENEQMMFVTLIYGVIDLRSGRLTYTNAGHNHPYRIDASGRLAPLPSTGGMAAAVMEEVAYRETALQLEPGDTIFLFTDGVTEAIDREDREFGTAALEAVLEREAAGSAVREVGERVIEAVRQFAGDTPQADDITCVTLRFHGCSGQLPASRSRAA